MIDTPPFGLKPIARRLAQNVKRMRAHFLRGKLAAGGGKAAPAVDPEATMSTSERIRYLCQLLGDRPQSALL